MDVMNSVHSHQDVLELFADEKEKGGFLNVSAPMVRYSKLEFRKLLRKNNVQLCFTPMIIADSFSRSEEARLNEFTTNPGDHPVIAQFAAKSTAEMLAATTLIYPYVDGVDLNCGCPQTWAIAKGYGCGLLRRPELIHDIMRTLRRNLPSTFSCSLKIRLLSEDVATTVDLCRQLERCGITFLTIHGRTQWQKTSHPLDIGAMAELKKSLQIPMIANGNVQTYRDACELQEQTKADGIMVARGLLANPGLFNNSANSVNENASLECIQQWLDIATEAGDNLSFQCFHHHLTFMWGKTMNRKLRVKFNNFSRKHQVFQFFDELYGVRPNTPVSEMVTNTVCTYNHYPSAAVKCCSSEGTHRLDPNSTTWDPNSRGSFFTDFTKNLQPAIDCGYNDEEDGLGLNFEACLIYDL